MDNKNPLTRKIKETYIKQSDMKDEPQKPSDNPEPTKHNTEPTTSEAKPKKRNRLDEVPEHLRDFYYSKSHFYMSTLLFKMRYDLAEFEKKHPELCNKTYKSLVFNVASMESLKEANEVLFFTNGYDFDATDYCEGIDEYMSKNNKKCEQFLLSGGIGYPVPDNLEDNKQDTN
jgi:hypothetical protein